jgi:hypothetical protein
MLNGPTLLTIHPSKLQENDWHKSKQCLNNLEPNFQFQIFAKHKKKEFFCIYFVTIASGLNQQSVLCECEFQPTNQNKQCENIVRPK